MDEVIEEASKKYQGLVPLVYDIETMGLDEARPEDMPYAVYLKREADKVIAEKDAAIADLIEKNKRLANKDMIMASETIKDIFKNLRHHKYHRCLDMAARCISEEKRLDAIAPLFDNDKECWEYNSDYWNKWHRRWLEIAAKFKEANND